MKKVVYLGNMLSVTELLKSRTDMKFSAWIIEKEDLADPALGDAFRACAVPAYAVDGSAALSKTLAKLSFDLGLIANFGLILGKEDLKTASGGFVNLHLGLLPEYPGRNPIQKALDASENTAGVTLHRAVERADAGPIIDRRMTAIPKSRLRGDVLVRLEEIALRVLSDNLGGLLK